MADSKPALLRTAGSSLVAAPLVGCPVARFLLAPGVADAR
jgi:hypothetical protein